MHLKRFASTALCALTLLTFTPAGTPAQTHQAPPLAAAAERRALAVPHAGARPQLKALFAESASRIGAARATEADFKRFERLRRQDDEQSSPPEKMSTRHKVLIVIAIIGVVAVTAWAIANSVDNPPSFCDTAPFDPDCIPT